MKKNWIRNIAGGLSLTTALFIFQACYGTPQDLGSDVFIEGKVKSKTTGKPVKGIKVTVNDNQHELSDENGEFSFYTQKTSSYSILFQDIDPNEDGSFFDNDTILQEIDEVVFLNMELEEK